MNFAGLNLCYDVCCPATRAVLRYGWRRYVANAISQQTVSRSGVSPSCDRYHEHRILQMYLSVLDVDVSAPIPSCAGRCSALLSLISAAMSARRRAETKQCVRHDVRRRAAFKVNGKISPTFNIVQLWQSDVESILAHLQSGTRTRSLNCCRSPARAVAKKSQIFNFKKCVCMHSYKFRPKSVLFHCV